MSVPDLNQPVAGSLIQNPAQGTGQTLGEPGSGRGSGLATVELSQISFALGEQHPLTDLGDSVPPDLLDPENGLKHYRVSDLETWRLAALAARGSLSPGGPVPDLLVYSSDSDPQPDAAAKLLAVELGLANVAIQTVTGHVCGNLGSALREARQALRSGTFHRVLLVLADRAPSDQRIMASGLSVFSDGAVAGIATAPATTTPETADPGRQRPRFLVHGIATRGQQTPSPQAAASSDLLNTVLLARGCVADIVGETGRQLTGYHHAVFGNYRLVSQRMLTLAMGLPGDRLLVGPIADLGHCFSADVLITLHQQAVAGQLRPGDQVLASLIGPASWSITAVEVR